MILPSVLLVIELPVILPSVQRTVTILPSADRVPSRGELELSPGARAVAGRVDSVVVTVTELHAPLLLLLVLVGVVVVVVVLDHTDTGRVTDPYPLLPRGYGPGRGAERVGWGFPRRPR